MKRNTSCKLVELLHPLTMHLAGNFLNYLLSLSHKNKYICELQNHSVLELTSHPASTHAQLNSVANQNGGNLMHFDGA